MMKILSVLFVCFISLFSAYAELPPMPKWSLDQLGASRYNDDKEKAEAWDTSDETIQNFMKKVIEQIVLTGGVVVLGREEYRAQRIKDARFACEKIMCRLAAMGARLPLIDPLVDEVVAEFEKELDKE